MPPPTASIEPMEPPRSVSVRRLFKIAGFDKTYENHQNRSVASTTTSACGYDWVIDYYPAVCHFCSFWVMLRITLASDVADGLVARFAGTLVDHLDHHRRLFGHLEVVPVTAEIRRGQPRDFFVMSRPDLFRSGYVHDDSFLLELEIAVLLDNNQNEATAVANAGNVSSAVPSSDLHNHFGELWRSQRGTDVTFLVSGEPIAAHRCVLAARSPVFMAELFGNMRETASPSVVVEDMEPAVFRALVHFIYTDTSPPELDSQGEEDEDAKATAKAMAQHLLAAADRYGMERLKVICEEKMCGDISVGTAAAHLVLAEQHGCPKLKDRCKEFIVATPENLRAVVATEGCKHLIASCPSVLSDLLVLVVQRQK